jgi:uncharacterized protein YwqG
MDKSEIIKKLTETGLNRVLPDLDKLIQSSIRLTSQPGDDSIAGLSRLGGLPDLPPGTSWPGWKGCSMAFIAQIRLEDLAPFEPASQLPKTGLLSFFYDANQETYGADPEDCGGWEVFYFGGESKDWRLAQAPRDLPADAIFCPCALKFSSELTLPSSPGQHLPDFDWSDSEIQLYEDFLAKFPTPDDYSLVHHRMFGHPNQLQDDMQLQCALTAPSIGSQAEAVADEAAQQKSEWQLLLQVDSDRDAAMKWATNGLLYFWIKTADLQAGRFDQAWLVMQAE